MLVQNKETKKEKLNIAIVQIYDDNIKEYAEYSRLLNAMYAHEKGYTYISFDYDLVPTFVSVYYNKIIAVHSVLHDSRNFDWVLYIDSDAAVSNFKYKIEDIIERHVDKEIIIAQDSNGVNNGVFLIKNTKNMKKFLEDSYNDKNFYHTKTPEQSAMFYYLQQDKYKNLVGSELPYHMNAYLNGYADLKSTKEDVKNWDKDSFIIHLFQLATQDRVNLFKQLLLIQNIICVSKPVETSKIKSENSNTNSNQ